MHFPLAVFPMLLMLCMLSTQAVAGLIYDEGVDGDLPHPSSATVLNFGLPNPNSISVTVDMDSDGYILDIAAGVQLDSFTLASFSGPEGATATFHIHNGPSTGDAALGTASYSSFNGAQLGQDFLTLFSIGPLGAGQYLVNHWHDRTPDPTVRFDLVFVLAPKLRLGARLGKLCFPRAVGLRSSRGDRLT
jgi:hypothetical protein